MFMKRIHTPLLPIVSLIIILLSSCSLNKFSTRKNFQPRVKVEATHTPLEEKTNIETFDIVEKNSQNDKEILATNHVKLSNVAASNKMEPKKTFADKVITTFFPKKAALLKPALQPQKNKLGRVEEPSMEGDRVAGLIIGIISLVTAITAAFMIIGMASGNIWVYFAVGMVLAVCAIILGAIGKNLPFKGLSIAGFTLGILVVVALLVMLVVFTVLGLL